jgi:carboxypeptidase PM20D1
MPVLALVAVLLVRTVLFTSRQMWVEPVRIPIDREAVAGRLAEAVRIRTVSSEGAEPATEQQILALHALLERAFPRVHAVLHREVINRRSLLFTWTGSVTSVKPVMFAAHLDVVPVDPRSERDWTHPPFSGAVAGGYVWGRGTLDDKAGVMGVLEAVEMLLAEGYEPRRTVLLAFGHDEELGGPEGATQIAAHLRAAGIRLDSVVDEGLLIVDGVIPAVAAPVAAVGIAEKGYVTVELVAERAGGHSSIPPPQSAIGILGAAVGRLEAHPVRARLDGAARTMFEFIGPEMPWPRRLVLANLWLFGVLVERQLAAAPSTNALLRTTVAPTLVEGGVKENVLPTHARAVLHIRLRPGDRIADVLAYAEATVGDRRVRIRQLDKGTEASAESNVASPAFESLARSIRQVFPDVIVAPSLFIGATDSRHYAGISENIFRFRPFRFGPQDLGRIHGTDERISIENYAELVRFYVQLIRNADLRPGRPTVPAR